MLFRNLGKKFRIAAIILFVIGIFPLFILVLRTGDLTLSAIVFVLGLLVLWLITALLYAFGEMVENVQTIKAYVDALSDNDGDNYI